MSETEWNGVRTVEAECSGTTEWSCCKIIDNCMITDILYLCNILC